MGTTVHFEQRFETYSFGCIFFITDLKYGSGTEDHTGLPYVFAKMELESAFIAATKRKVNLYNFKISEQDKIMVSAELLFPSKTYESNDRNEQDRILMNKENFGTIGWHRKEADTLNDYDVYVNFDLTLPKEMLNNILLLRKENSFYAEISYWLLEEKRDDGPPEQKFIVNEFQIREMHTYYPELQYASRKTTLAGQSLFLKIWQLLKRVV